MKQLIVICFSLCFLASSAQDKNQFFALDAKMNQTVLDSSKYVLWIHEKEDSNWQWDYYATWGPLIKSQSYADHDGKILNGRSSVYNTTGNIDSTGIYDHGKKNGSFYKYRTYTKDSMMAIKQYDYSEDSLTKFVDLIAENSKKKQTDTAGGTESEYPGGIAKWNEFLSQNLVYPERAKSKDIQGMVKILFIVDSSGHVRDPFISKSVEYSLDQESLRVIEKSGQWNPAFQDGAYKKRYKMMPINYRLE